MLNYRWHRRTVAVSPQGCVQVYAFPQRTGGRIFPLFVIGCPLGYAERGRYYGSCCGYLRRAFCLLLGYHRRYHHLYHHFQQQKEITAQAQLMRLFL